MSEGFSSPAEMIAICGSTALRDSGMVEFIGILGYYALVAMTLDVFRVPLPEGAKLPFAEPKI